MPQFERDGASIHYETAGSGPPLLLVAGIATDSASWRPLMPLLMPRFSLVMIDNRGAGRSTADGDLRIDDMIADCAALLDQLGIAQADVVGHSMGGLIAAGLAIRHPGHVRRLVTMTSAGNIGAKESTLFKDMARLYAGGMKPQTWFRLLFQWLFSEPFFANENNVAAAAEASAAYPFRQSPENFVRQTEAVERLGVFDFSAITCPTLAIAAELDLLVTPAAVFAAHAGIKNLQTVTVAGAAHSVYWEAPAKVAAAITEFLAET